MYELKRVFAAFSAQLCTPPLPAHCPETRFTAVLRPQHPTSQNVAMSHRVRSAAQWLAAAIRSSHCAARHHRRSTCGLLARLLQLLHALELGAGLAVLPPHVRELFCCFRKQRVLHVFCSTRGVAVRSSTGPRQRSQRHHVRACTYSRARIGGGSGTDRECVHVAPLSATDACTITHSSSLCIPCSVTLGRQVCHSSSPVPCCYAQHWSVSTAACICSSPECCNSKSRPAVLDLHASTRSCSPYPSTPRLACRARFAAARPLNCQ